MDLVLLLWNISVALLVFIYPALLASDQRGFRRLYVLQPGPSGTDRVRLSSISSVSGASGQPNSYNVEIKASFGGQVRTRRMGHQLNPSFPNRPDAQPVRRTTSRHMKVSGVNVCGGRCCVGWSKTPVSQRCAKPSCSPPCKNGGMCLRPHVCVCKSGSKGKSCEQNALPPSSHPTGPLNGHGNGQNIIPQRPIPQQSFPNGPQLPGTGPMTPSMKPSSNGRILYQPPAQKPVSMMTHQHKCPKFTIQQKNHHTQTQMNRVGPTLNRADPLSVGHNPLQMGNHTGRIKVVFTPTICKMTCANGRCQNICQPGNTTTIISENGHATDTLTAPNFRVVVCHLPCMNGGKCSTRDRCQCPPNFTGKFCQMHNPNSHQGQQTTVNGQKTQVHSSHTLPLTYGTGQNQGFVKHPPEASGQVHQVSPVDSTRQLQNSQSSGSFTHHVSESSSSRNIQHGHDHGGVIYPNQQTFLQHQPVTSKSQLGRCFQETTGMQCGKALPGLSKQDFCCATVGTSWGFHKCQKCPKKTSILLQRPTTMTECPQGYKRLNATRCVDIDECQIQPVCAGGKCINTMGSFRCSCSLGFIPDPSFSSCIPETPAVQEEKGACFRLVSSGKQCLHPVSTQLSKQLCCCSVGKAWGPRCERCPLPGTAAFKEICPGGTGYHVTTPFIYKPKPPGRRPSDGQGQDKPRITHQTPADPPMPLPTLQQSVEALSITERQLPEVVEKTSSPAPVAIQPSHESQDLSPTQLTEVDECHVSPHICGAGLCYNTPDSYTCVCHDGFRTDSGGTTCVDVDECAERSSLCANGYCQNTAGGFQCVCEPGFMSSEDGTSCSDIDECQDVKVCPSGLCSNTLGSFICSPCSDGFEGRNGQCVDVDECLDESVCSHGRCNNHEGYFTCTCDSGFSLASDGKTCTDIDECEDDSVCAQGRCQNTEASFICSCDTGFQLSFTGDQCDDVDECLELHQTCDGVGQCVNILGSYECNCPQGYRQVNGTSCQDADECEEDTQLCSQNGECLNTEGSFLCVCDAGFVSTLDPPGCEDVDECVDGSRCINGTCSNTEGSYLCQCEGGYRLDSTNQACQDVNECAVLTDVCGEATCENREGSFLCLCSDDTQEFDPMTGRCFSTPPVEKKECYYNLNDENLCDNVLASSITIEECCCTLGAGWGDNCEVHPCPSPGTEQFSQMCPAGGGRVSTADSTTAGVSSAELFRDADECVLFADEICKDGYCLNTPGSYECYCKSGLYYDENKLQCVDECQDESHCIGGECMNTYSSYQCFCTPPLVLAPDANRCISPAVEGQREVEVFEGICWETVTDELTCTKPVTNRHTTFTECCCLYGEAWGLDCALCPHKNTDTYASMCNTRLTGGLRRPYGQDGEYEVGPAYDPPPLNPGGLYEDYEKAKGPYDAFEGLRAEECGVLNGCGNGRCVRVREGFTCDCFHGYALDVSRTACVDINECAELASLCKNGKCVNTQGSFNCVCLPGFAHSARLNYCASLE